METTLKFAMARADLARNHFHPVMTALELARPFGRVEIDDCAEIPYWGSARITTVVN
jgi:hypothetical protein